MSRVIGYVEQLVAPSSGDGSRYETGSAVAVEQYGRSAEARPLQETIERHVALNGRTSSMVEVAGGGNVGASFGRQLKWLLWRSMADGKRNPMRTITLNTRLLILGIVVGLTFFRLTPGDNGYIPCKNNPHFNERNDSEFSWKI